MLPFKNFHRFASKVWRQPDYAARVAIKRLAAYFYYNFPKGISSSIESITLFLTHRCNLRCKMCGQWGESGVTKTMCDSLIKEELSLEQFKKVIDDVKSWQPSITLFGGEPLLHSDCIELIRYIKKQKMHCLMISNGFLVKQQAKELVDSGLEELNISLDGGQDLHNQIRGMEGLFEGIIEGLKLLNKYKQEKNTTKPLINLQCTITKYNYDKLEQLIVVAKDICANSLTYHNLIFLGQDLIDKQKTYDDILKCSSSAWEGFISEPEIDPEKLAKNIKEILSKQYDFAVDFYPNLSKKGITEYYNNPSYKPKEYPGRCISPWIVSYVFPDGQVRPCLNCTFSFGNVKQTKFKDIWNSENAKLYRQTLKKNKIFPVCVRCTELYRY